MNNLHELLYLVMITKKYFIFFFFFNDPPPTEIYTLSLHDALPISGSHPALAGESRRSDSPALPGIGAVPPQIEMRSISPVLFLNLPLAAQVNTIRNRRRLGVGSGLGFDSRRLERFVPAYQQPPPVTALHHSGITQGKDHGPLSLITPFKPIVVELHRKPRD